MAKAPSNYLAPVQVLRFLAAAMVLFGHAQHEAVEMGVVRAGSSFGFNPFEWGSGVDIFFIVSGFIMYYLCHDAFGKPGEARRFFLRRLVRLVPTYWFFTALMLVATLLFASQLAHPEIDLAHLAASLFFIPWPNPQGATVPFLILGWTLNYEVLFYAVFGLCLLLPARAGLAVLVGLFGLAALLHGSVPAQHWMMAFWTDPIILEFLFGIGLAAAYLAGWRVSGPAAVALALAGFAALALLYALGWQARDLRFLWAGVPALMIAAAFALQRETQVRGRGEALLVLCGNASYSLYLSHPFTINAIGLVWRKLGLAMPWAFVAAVCLASIAASVVVYVLIEKPLVDGLGRKLNTRWRPAARPT
ncbi:acyltransferase family protein [Ancylobacter terrae]|uniref:acyltransferase family protein n=1 Tax=Ancylobacter sp. sgz301288 TaxID=3342077 RepID=UPI00385AE55D